MHRSRSTWQNGRKSPVMLMLNIEWIFLFIVLCLPSCLILCLGAWLILRRFPRFRGFHLPMLIVIGVSDYVKAATNASWAKLFSRNEMVGIVLIMLFGLASQYSDFIYWLVGWLDMYAILSSETILASSFTRLRSCFCHFNSIDVINWYLALAVDSHNGRHLFLEFG